MNAELRSRTFYYKQCRIDNGPAPLSLLLKSALIARQAVAERLQVVPPNDEGKRLVNEHLIDHGFVFGSLVEWTPGRFQPVIDVIVERETLNVTLLPPGERQEFLDGIGYFLAFGNHLVFSKGKAIGPAALENHLEWLLRDCAHLLPAESHLWLFDAPQKPGSPLASRVKSVMLSPAPVNEPKRTTSVARESIFARNDVARALIEKLRELRLLKLGEERLEHLLADKNLRASIKISYRGTPPEDGVQLLDVLAQALRNADGEWGYAFDVPGVGRVHGGQLTLKSSRLVPHLPSGYPSIEDMAATMKAWLNELIARNEIAAEV